MKEEFGIRILFRNIIWLIDANRIVKIPLVVGIMDAFVSWHLNRNDIFSIKSSYHVEWDRDIISHCHREANRAALF